MPSSRVLEEVIDQAPAGYFTVGWLTSTLQQRSFGIVMLFLGLLATLPVGSTIPGLILAVMAVQLIVGRAEPIFTHFIMARRNSSARRRCCLGVGIGARPSLTHQTLDRRARWLLQCNRNNRRCVGSAYRRDARCGSRAPVADRFAGSFAWCVRRRRERQPLQPIGQKPKLRGQWRNAVSNNS
jgi:Exopolysaccharide synthesis, ExoD